jgi:hypothetical protein
MATSVPWTRRRALRRVADHLWNSPDPFDFDNKQPADYYRVVIADHEDNPYARIIKITGDTLDVKLWNGDAEEFQDEATIPVDSLEDYVLKVGRKYHKLGIRYASEAEFLLKDWWYPFAFGLREWLLQSSYQIVTSIRADRVEVLAAVLDKRLNDNSFDYVLGNDTVTSEGLMVKMFGRRVLNHSDGGRISSKIDLILKSLVESGDLEPVGEHAFRPRGQAITTISQAATEDRRHRAITWLTAALVFVGLLAVDWGRLLGWVTTCIAPLPK